MRILSLPAAMVTALLIPALLSGAELKGTVKYAGSPVVETVQVTADRSVCGQTLKKVRLAVDQNGGVKDAVVWLEGVKAPASASRSQAVIDQKQCQFVPRIVAAQKGTTLKVLSDDPILHNAHGIWMDTNKTAFNVAVPIPGMSVDVRLERAGRMKVRCDAGHTWMEAYILVFDHPFFAVTDSNGRFTIENVPSGTYKLHVWHPETGEITKEVRVPGTVTIELTKTKRKTSR